MIDEIRQHLLWRIRRCGDWCVSLEFDPCVSDRYYGYYLPPRYYVFSRFCILSCPCLQQESWIRGQLTNPVNSIQDHVVISLCSFGLGRGRPLEIALDQHLESAIDLQAQRLSLREYLLSAPVIGPSLVEEHHPNQHEVSDGDGRAGGESSGQGCAPKGVMVSCVQDAVADHF